MWLGIRRRSDGETAPMGGDARAEPPSRVYANDELSRAAAGAREIARSSRKAWLSKCHKCVPRP